MNKKRNTRYAVLAFLSVVLFTFLLTSCSKKEELTKGAIVTSFTKQNYYENSPEVPDEFVLKIKDAITLEDSARLCVRLKNLSIDNLSADLLVSFNNYSADNIFINGVISFDPEGNPSQDTTNYEWLQKALNYVRLIDSIEYKEGSFQMRLQLEKLCQ